MRGLAVVQLYLTDQISMNCPFYLLKIFSELLTKIYKWILQKVEETVLVKIMENKKHTLYPGFIKTPADVMLHILILFQNAFLYHYHYPSLRWTLYRW